MVSQSSGDLKLFSHKCHTHASPCCRLHISSVHICTHTSLVMHLYVKSHTVVIRKTAQSFTAHQCKPIYTADCQPIRPHTHIFRSTYAPVIPVPQSGLVNLTMSICQPWRTRALGPISRKRNWCPSVTWLMTSA